MNAPAVDGHASFIAARKDAICAGRGRLVDLRQALHTAVRFT
jgi:hypothetical protein